MKVILGAIALFIAAVIATCLVADLVMRSGPVI